MFAEVLFILKNLFHVWDRQGLEIARKVIFEGLLFQGFSLDCVPYGVRSEENCSHDECVPDPLEMGVRCFVSSWLGDHVMALDFLILRLDPVYFVLKHLSVAKGPVLD